MEILVQVHIPFRRSMVWSSRYLAQKPSWEAPSVGSTSICLRDFCVNSWAVAWRPVGSCEAGERGRGSLCLVPLVKYCPAFSTYNHRWWSAKCLPFHKLGDSFRTWCVPWCIQSYLLIFSTHGNVAMQSDWSKCSYDRLRAGFSAFCLILQKMVLGYLLGWKVSPHSP